MYKIDKIDRDIVSLLMIDGRMAVAEVARQVGGISERAVRYRIDRMVAEGIIKISAIPNPRVLGYGVVADVWLEVDADSIHAVAQKMTEYECVSYVAYSIGETDVSIQVVARDNDEVYRFVTDVIGKIAGIRKTVTSIVPRVLKDVYQWRIPSSVCIDRSGDE